MNEGEKHNLRINQVEFVNNLEATDILDYLLEDGIFTENDCELISNSKTRRERAQLLLAMLPTRGPNAYGSFKRALNLGKYDFLGEKLSQIQRSTPGHVELRQKDDSRRSNDLQACMTIISGCKNDVFKFLLRHHVFLLIDNIEPRDIIDHFYQEQIIGEDGVELVKLGKTRKERCFMFLRELSKSSSNILVDILRKSLNKKYSYITKTIQKTLENMCHSNVNNNQSQNMTNEPCQCELNNTQRKEMRVPSENTEPMTETNPKIAGHTPSVTSCKQINRHSEVFDQTEMKNLSHGDVAKGMLVPSENTELFSQNTELFTTNNNVSGQMPSVTSCKRINTQTEMFDQTKIANEIHAATNHTELFSQNTELFTNDTEVSGQTLSVTACKQINTLTEMFNQTETKIKQVPGFVHRNDPCEHETCSFTEETVPLGDPGNQLEFSFLSSDNHLDSKSNGKSAKMYTQTNHPLAENCIPGSISDLVHCEKLDPASFENVADSAGIVPQRVVCDVSKGTKDKTESRFLYRNQIYTDSEGEETKVINKQRRKPNNSKKKINTRITVCNGEKYQCRKDQIEVENHKRVGEEQNVQAIVSTEEHTPMVGRNAYSNCISNYQPNTANSNLPGRHLVLTFNYLSTLINQGNFDKFELFSSNLHRRYAKDPDMICLLGYLHASRDLFKTDFDSAKKHIDRAFEIVPKTSNPKYFTLELFTSKTRMYITQKKLEKLQNALDDAKMIIETDPMGCTGRAAGWLYMNDARNCTAQIGLLNFRYPNAITSYTKLHKRAKASFEKALINFQRDGGKDGPFGFGYALCRLAILLLQCGDNGRTMDILLPPEEDIKLAGDHLKHLEDSEIAIPKILEMHFVLAKCDYQFRRRNTIRSLEYAELAHEIASELKLFEFTEHAHNRCVFLRTKTPLVIDDVSEDEFTSLLFGEAVESQSSE